MFGFGTGYRGITLEQSKPKRVAGRLIETFVNAERK
jgi:hypothetical protein